MFFSHLDDPQAIIDEWLGYESYDYYFYVGKESEHNEPVGLLIAICPILFFQEHGHYYDGHLDIKVPFLTQIGGCLFEPWTDLVEKDDLREFLGGLGFGEDHEFSDFCSNHDPFV